jgi:uncharacterized protein (UPF0276 family)
MSTLMQQNIVHHAGPISGVGIGLRTQHYHEIFAEPPALPWFEVLTDNFMSPGGMTLANLERIRERYPIVMHSVGLSIGSTDPIDFEYLKGLKTLKDRFAPTWVSEHLCWTSVHGRHFHDLMPLPYTEEVVKHVAERIKIIQDFFGERMLIENVSSYLNYKDSTMSEWEFVTAVAETADCFLLFDVNNIHVSATNHGFNASEYINGIPAERVKQFHLAGFEDNGNHLLDSHSRPVSNEVWELYRQALRRFGPVPTLIEWDADIPPLKVMMGEVAKAENEMRLIFKAA